MNLLGKETCSTSFKKNRKCFQKQASHFHVMSRRRLLLPPPLEARSACYRAVPVGSKSSTRVADRRLLLTPTKFRGVLCAHEPLCCPTVAHATYTRTKLLSACPAELSSKRWQPHAPVATLSYCARLPKVRSAELGA